MQQQLNNSHGTWNDIWDWIVAHIEKNSLKLNNRETKIDTVLEKILMEKGNKSKTTMSSLSKICWRHLKTEPPIISAATAADIALKSNGNHNLLQSIYLQQQQQNQLQCQQLPSEETHDNLSMKMMNANNEDMVFIQNSSSQFNSCVNTPNLVQNVYQSSFNGSINNLCNENGNNRYEQVTNTDFHNDNDLDLFHNLFLPDVLTKFDDNQSNTNENDTVFNSQFFKF